MVCLGICTCTGVVLEAVVMFHASSDVDAKAERMFRSGNNHLQT